jgi:hypothetical protein
MDDLGRLLGEGLARLLDSIPGAGDAMRAAFAKKYGVCRVCKAPLGGYSPQQICEPCHAGEVLAQGLGGGPTGDA